MADANGMSRGRLDAVNRLTSEEEILVEWAKGLIASSIATSIDFHKTLLGLTATFTTLMAGAIGVLIFGKTGADLSAVRWALVIPTALMLSSSIAFCFGYYPRPVDVPLGDPKSLRLLREGIIKRRERWAFVGCGLFTLSVMAFCLVSVLEPATANQPKRPNFRLPGIVEAISPLPEESSLYRREMP